MNREVKVEDSRLKSFTAIDGDHLSEGETLLTPESAVKIFAQLSAMA